MADEIRVQASLEADNDNFKFPKHGNDVQLIDQQRAAGGVPGKIVATTAGVNIDTSALVVEGWARFTNLDANNFVQIGPEDTSVFYPFGKLKPGESCVLRLDPGKTYHVKADTADCDMHITILED